VGVRRLRASLVAAFVLVSLFPLSSNAAVPAGTKCVKLGAQQTYKGKKYTCIKLGQKLYWNNGVKVQKVSPTPTPTPTPSPTPTATSTTKPSPTATSTLSVSRANAVKAAASYLRSSAFSRSGLIKQLAYEGYSNEDAVFAVDAQQADWRANAVKAAASYLRSSAFSRSGLINQLMYEGYSLADSEYAATAAGL